MSRNLPRILYIAGYGRSGSTVLDVLLGSHEQMVSVGELVYLGEEWRDEGRTCACGADYQRCSSWADIVKNADDAAELSRLSRQVEHRRALPRLLTGTLSTQIRTDYRDRLRRLFDSIAEKEGIDWIVDSSKTARHAAGRFWALRKIAGLDVRVVHLVRDGRAVLRSVVERGTNWAAEGYRAEKAFRAERTVVGWTLANGLSWALGTALDADRYLRVRFEDLLSRPETVFGKIGNFIGKDLSPVIKRVASGGSFSVGHNVGGNRMRHKKRIRLRRRQDDRRNAWEDLRPYHRVLFGLFGQWMNHSFGYTW